MVAANKKKSANKQLLVDSGFVKRVEFIQCKCSAHIHALGMPDARKYQHDAQPKADDEI